MPGRTSRPPIFRGKDILAVVVTLAALGLLFFGLPLVPPIVGYIVVGAAAAAVPAWVLYTFIRDLVREIRQRRRER